MNWTDPKTGETTKGFKEMGFLPQAFVNMLAMLGWNPGTEQEIFSLDELVKTFSIERVHKGGAKFDFEKAKWFNHQYIQHTDNATLTKLVLPYITSQTHDSQLTTHDYIEKVVALIKDRCTLLPDFWAQGHFFFTTPETIDTDSLKWNDQKQAFFTELASQLPGLQPWTHDAIEAFTNELATKHNLKKGDVMLPLRIMLVGGKYGPGVFIIAEMIGLEETVKRINKVTG
jgi:glutamyl-tRNA synthetase